MAVAKKEIISGKLFRCQEREDSVATGRIRYDARPRRRRGMAGEPHKVSGSPNNVCGVRISLRFSGMMFFYDTPGVGAVRQGLSNGIRRDRSWGCWGGAG